jgi:signal transduction histidine kinase
LLDSVIEVHAVGCKVAISIDCPADLTGYFDLALVERVLHNLVGNAIRYCKTNGEIRLTAQRLDPADPHSIEIGVFNNGPVIPPEGRIMYRGKSDGPTFFIRLPGRS